MANQHSQIKYYSKSELAEMANVSYSTFYRYLKSRRKIFCQMGISIYAKKLPANIVKYISRDYCIDE
jgi:AcrR family transcriptional regulator